MAPGVLIALEGIDGAGKTTLAEGLRAALLAAGEEVLLTKEPTNGPWGQKIRASKRGERMPFDEEVDCFLRDRREHVEQELRPALDRGACVLVDRYFLSTAAYQGVRGSTPEALLVANEAFAPLPDVLFHVQVPVRVGRGRIHARGDLPDSFEGEQALMEVAAAFDRFERPYIVRLDGTRPAPEVLSDALAVLAAGPLAGRLPAPEASP